jgi:hypothetical protein
MTTYDQVRAVVLGIGIISVLVTFPASALLLWRYRRAVLRGMKSLNEDVPAADVVTPADAPPKPLRFVSLDVNAAPRATLPSPWVTAVIYLAAGAAYALIMTSALELARARLNHEFEAWLSVLLQFWLFLWPAMVAVILVAAQDRIQKIWIVLGYFVAYVALVCMARDIGGSFFNRLVIHPDQFLRIWFFWNGPATVLLYLSLMRRIRSVGPLVLVFVTGTLGFALMVAFLSIFSETGKRTALTTIGSQVGLGAAGVFLAMLLLGLLPCIAFGWLMLRWIGARYSAKKFSDESLTVDAVFVLFSIMPSYHLAAFDWKWLAAGLVALIAYKVVARIGFRLLPITPVPTRLLLLRVFALGKRSGPLFDAMRKAWLRGGAIAMIAGPDLVTSAVEPHEFLAFLSGKLGRTFVADDADLSRRAAAIDSQPDPDGRYRIAEFFCRADTWQPTMRRLVAESDAVLMDLRSFSASNQGCVFELGRLLDAIDLSRVVFVVDKTTDRSFLQETLQQQWSNLAAKSPNRSAAEPAARFFEVHRPTAAETRALIGHLTTSYNETGGAPPVNATRSPSRRFQFNKCSQLFISTHNETFPVASVCISNPDCSAVEINR